MQFIHYVKLICITSCLVINSGKQNGTIIYNKLTRIEFSSSVWTTVEKVDLNLLSKVVVYRIHYLGSGRNRIRIFFQNQYPAGTRSGSFFQIKIRPEPDPDLFFKLISGRNRTRIFF